MRAANSSRKIGVIFGNEQFETQVDRDVSAANILIAVHRQLNLPGRSDEYQLVFQGEGSIDWPTFRVARLTGEAAGRSRAGEAGTSYKRVFVSHAHADRSLASTVTSFLVEAEGIRGAEILCTSVRGYAIPVGQDPISFMKEALVSSSVVLPLITSQFLESTFCMFETGGAWALGSACLPLLHSSVQPDQIPDVLRVQAASLDSESEICGLGEEVARLLGLGQPCTESLLRLAQGVAAAAR